MSHQRLFPSFPMPTVGHFCPAGKPLGIPLPKLPKQWSIPGGDVLRRASLHPDVESDVPTGAELWSVDRGMCAYSVANDADKDGTVEIYSSDDLGYCRFTSGGALEWSKAEPPDGRRATRSPYVEKDLDGDGLIEVLAGDWGGNLYCLNCEDGSTKWSYPASDTKMPATFAEDINGDGVVEVIATLYDGTYWGVYCLDGRDGSLIWEYRPAAHAFAFCFIDWEQKRKPRIFVVEGTFIKLLNPDGTIDVQVDEGVSGWAGTIEDIDGDGKPEHTRIENKVAQRMMDHDFSLIWERADTRRFWYNEDHVGGYSLRDIDGDGRFELGIGGEGFILILKADDGSLVWESGYPGGDSTTIFGGDVDGDGIADVFGTSYSAPDEAICYSGADGSVIWAVDLASAYEQSPSLPDIEGDGKHEMMLGGYSPDYTHCLKG